MGRCAVECYSAEPHIHVRYLDRTPADAAETVRYINIEQGYGVRYWAIGNEAPYFYRDETADHYAATWRDFAEAMLAVDPSSQVSGGALLGDRTRMRFTPDERRLFFRWPGSRPAPAHR